MERNEPTWLEALLSEAKRKNWCINAWCSTCGSLMFRNELLPRAARHVGVELPPHGLRRSGPLAKNLDPENLQRCCTAILESMATLPESMGRGFHIAAVIFILNDLHQMMWPFLGVIETALEGTWVGEEYKALQEERVESRERAERHERRQKEERRLAVERRTQRTRERKAAIEARAHLKVERDLRRLAFLDELATLAPKTRIERLLNDDVEFPIGAVPADLIPDCKDLVRFLEPDTRARLIKTIGRRRGVWAPLRKVLAAIESAPEGSLS